MNNKLLPKVSIIIPVYNGSNYLKEAIDSALAQTYKNIEIIVVNDGSNDEGATDKIAKSYGKKIKYFKKENGGVATALNLGIEKMTGEYFSWLSHDDLFKRNKLSKQLKFLSRLKNKNVVLYSNYELIDECGNRLSTWILDHEMLSRTQIYALLRGCVNGITMLIPAVAFKECGGFDVSLRCTQDYDMWYKMIQKYEFIHLKDVLSSTRIHSMQDTVANPKTIDECNVLWIKMIKNLSDNEKIRIEGNLYNFYAEMIRFLRTTQYIGAIDYCQKKLRSIVDGDKYEKYDADETSDLLDKNWKKPGEGIGLEDKNIVYRAVRKIYKEGPRSFAKACSRRITKR